VQPGRKSFSRLPVRNGAKDRAVAAAAKAGEPQQSEGEPALPQLIRAAIYQR